jgi:perosamine synthetase
VQGSGAASGSVPADRMSNRRGPEDSPGYAGVDGPVPLAKPVLGEAEELAVLEVLRSGQLSLGPRVGEFERLFAARVGAGHACAVSSGTAGLHLALRAVGVEAGDEVITSPFSFVASANAAVYEGARPVFADIDPVTLNLDPAAAEAAVTSRTKAIARAHGLGIVEDACEALGAVHGDGDEDGVAVGGRGNPAVFGFYANKQITTGEGGMVALGDGELKARIDSERNQGRARDMGWLDHDRLGFNYRLSDIACALGIAQLGRLGEMLAGRARVAGWYREALAGVEGLGLPCVDMGGDRRGWFVFVVQLPTGVERDMVIRRLAESGVQSKPYLPAIHLMGYYRERFGHRPGEFPVCEDVAARSLALPFFPEMAAGQVERVAGELVRALGR